MSGAIVLEEPKDAGDGAVAHQNANAKSHDYGYKQEKCCEECDQVRHPVMRFARIPDSPLPSAREPITFEPAMVRSLSVFSSTV